MDAQFTETKGFFARWLALWMLCAMPSLPVPVSPRMRTFAFVRANFSARAMISFMRSDSVRMSGKRMRA